MKTLKLILVVIVVSGLIYACEQSSKQSPLAPETPGNVTLARHDIVDFFEADLLPVDQRAQQAPGPSGTAAFARSFINDRRLTIWVNHFPIDGEFPIQMCGSEDDLSISVNEGYGKLSLWTIRGEFVPECQENDEVQVSTPDGNPLLAGAFYSNCGNRCHGF